MSATALRVGLISDTHGLVRPQALDALRGCDLILHAGDVGRPEVLDHLREIAPLRAVRGNNDFGPWARELPEDDVVEVAGRALYLRHDLAELRIDPAVAGLHVVITGHSHLPRIEERGGVLFVNPGSAGPRRFDYPISVASLRLGARRISARLHELDAA